MESICALLATVILIFPLIIQLQMLIVRNSRSIPYSFFLISQESVIRSSNILFEVIITLSIRVFSFRSSLPRILKRLRDFRRQFVQRKIYTYIFKILAAIR